MVIEITFAIKCLKKYYIKKIINNLTWSLHANHILYQELNRYKEKIVWFLAEKRKDDMELEMMSLKSNRLQI